ncbi:unnamed protein product [Nippostrongylus brasiliensis]|uniref:Secreted protein n=1 Tax=Nippostrongylus brasiliensis TaxID=27835 RepID=A0A0N4YVX9_NIPBR|nr:unnamed protein product [Nippostrongylus brasiliensis]
MVCRVYMREESPWVLTIVVVPASAHAVPLLFCLCDEPLLAMHLGKRNSPPPERVVDRRFSSSPSAKLNDERKPVGIAMDHAVVRGILDEQCDCVSLEGDKCSKTSYCGESKAQLSFSNILRGTFKQVPGLPYFYYTPQHKESDTRFTGKSELAFFEGLFSDQPVRVGEAATLDRKMSEFFFHKL